MKLSKLLKNTKYNILSGSTDIDINGMSIDSRKIQKSNLFFCITGFNVDGHNFIDAAVKNGAVAIVVEKDIKKIYKGITVVKVDDTREAISQICNIFYDYPSKKFNLIGITGTNGKTSSTYFMESILKQHNCNVGVIGTIETRINGNKVKFDFATSTTPDTIELNQLFVKMISEKVDNVVMEVSSHALELEKVDCCDFDIAIFTNLTQDHLDLHKTMENYCNAKARLFKMCKYGIINADDKYSHKIIEQSNCEITTFSIDNESNLKAKNIEYNMDNVKFTVNINNKDVDFILNVPGRFSVYNALGVIAAALKMNIPIDVIQKGISSVKGVPGRIQNIKNNKGFNVIVDYAHTPDGLENIIKAVREFTNRKVITVFGCGGDRDKKKRPIMGNIAAKLSDYTIITSDNPRSEEPIDILKDIEVAVKNVTDNYEMFVDRKEAIFKAIKIAKKGDSVIIAGKGHEDYEIFKDKTIHFDDAETAKEALEDL